MEIIFDIQKNIVQQFDAIAKQLLLSTTLQVNGQDYKFTEIEFYVFHETLHPDPFVHKDQKQQESNTWYFHGSGLDITIGSPDSYGGILIRGIKKEEKGTALYFDGPLNLLKELFSKFNLLSSSQEFGLCPIQEENRVIYKSTRVGLNPNKKEKGVEYAAKRYRYLIDKNPKHKYKEKEFVDKVNEEL